MALHHLSDMTLEELDEFIHVNSEQMHISQADAIALRLRRQRRAYIFGKEQPPLIDYIVDCNNNANSDKKKTPGRCFLNKPLRLLILGEETNAKLELAALLYGDKYVRQRQQLLEADFAEEYTTVDSNCVKKAVNFDDFPLLEVFVPGVADVTASLCGELCVCTDVILLCFSLTDRSTFDALRERWWKELLRAFDVLAQDLKDAPRSVQWPVTPFFVVALAAESRRESANTPAAAVVSHTEAVQLSRDMGASKYLEVFSGNIHHASCLVAQCTNVAYAIEHSLSSTVALLFFASAKQYMLRSYLRVPKPEGKLDMHRMKFALSVTPGITYVFTADGSDPRCNSTHSESLVKVPKDGVIDLRMYYNRPNTTLRICGKARCAYTSCILKVVVPSMVMPPRGYFDPVWRRFVVTPDIQNNDISSTCREIRYTLDGSKPTRKSLLCNDFIQLDATTVADSPWGPWRGTVPPPRVIHLAAFAYEGVSSPSVAYETPALLETPKIVYSARDSTIYLESTNPMVEYRYTLDGKTPTHMSQLYSGPLSINADTTQQVRVVAFPKVFFPSREAVFSLPKGNLMSTRAEKNSACSFYMTRTAIMRGESAARKTNSGAIGTSTTRRTNSARNTNRRTNGGVEERSTKKLSCVRGRTSYVDTAAETLKAAQQMQTPPQQQTYKNFVLCTDGSGDLSFFTSGGREQQKNFVSSSEKEIIKNFKKDGKLMDKGAKTTNKTGPLCMADGNTVVFEFPDPISLSHLTVMTPGGGAGPTFYEVEVKHLHGKDFLSVGSGDFQDIKGLQKLNVMANTSLFPVDKVRCVFNGGSNGFSISDLKVCGKPFKSNSCN